MTAKAAVASLGPPDPARAAAAPPAPPVSPGSLDADGERFGIGEAANRAGVSERALRYYQEIKLLEPSGRTAGGMRRYSPADLARVARIRELQELLGLNLEEIRVALEVEDRLDAVRREYRQDGTGAARRVELLVEALAIREQLRHTVEVKLGGLQRFLADLDAGISRVRELLAASEPQEPSDQVN